MDSFANDLRAQLSDYMDIEKVFLRLEEQNSLGKIHDVLYPVIADSAKNILHEVLRKNQHVERDEEQLRQNYERNLNLFKSKFIGITQIMMENIFKSDLLKEPKTRRPEVKTGKAEKSARLSGSITSTRETERADTIRLAPKKKQNTIQLENKKRREKLNRPNTAAIKEVSVVLRKQSVGSMKRLDSTNNTTIKHWDTKMEGYSPYSKSNSFSNTVLISSPMNKSIRTDRGKDDRSFPQTPVSPSRKMSRNPSMSSFYTVPHLNTSMPSVVQSEFNYIQGASTFRRAKRESWIDSVARTDSPGPGMYTPRSQDGSRSPAIGKSPRISWVDEVARTESPGPAAYTPKSQKGSRSPVIGQAPRESWIDVVARTDSPGPGKYTTRSQGSSPSHSMTKSPRKSWVDEVAWTESPGPATYYGSKHFLSK